MRFYDCRTAPSPRRVRVFIAEKGIDIETVQVDLASGEQFSDEYRAINPDCVVPALQLDDGSCISEVGAICHYLEERFPEPTLFGVTAEQRAATIMWNNKAEQQGMLACAEAFRNFAKGLKGRAITGPDDYEQIPALAEPWFLAFNASIEIHPVMVPDDLAKAGNAIEAAVKKYS